MSVVPRSPATLAVRGPYSHKSRPKSDWPSAWIAATVLLAVFSVRVAEVIPVLSDLRPAWITLLTVVPWLIWRTGSKPIRIALRDPFARLLMLYVGIGVVGVPFAIYRRAAFFQIESLLLGVLVVLAFLIVTPDRRNLDRLAWGFLLSVSVMGTLLLLNPVYQAGRLTTGRSLDPNDLASMMGAAFPFALARFFRSRGIGRFLALGTGGILVVVLMETGSRGGLVGFALGLLVLLAGMRGSRMLVLAVLLAVGVPVAWQFAPKVFKDRVGSLVSLEDDYNLTEDTGRIGTWTRGIGYTLDRPLTGVGMNNFGVAEGERLLRLNEAAPWNTAHNTYIQAFAEMGFPGGIVLLLLLWKAFRAAARFWRPSLRARRMGMPHRPEYLASLMAFSSAAFFLSHALAFNLFAILAILAHCDRVGRRIMRESGLAGYQG